MFNRKNIKVKHEADLSAKQNKAGKKTRVFETDVHQAGAAGTQAEAGQGTQATNCLIRGKAAGP